MELFSVHNITKNYASTTALRNVSLSVNEGCIFGLLGPNGAGKTSLIRIINQITAPDEGKIFFRGRPLQSTDIEHIGYLPEERGLYKKMKVGEQALYLAQLKGMPKDLAMQELKKWFIRFEIQDWWNKKVEELSKGMQQKIQFIVTVVHKPSLLIFDEPFSGFDPINTEILKKEILNLKNEGSTIIFSTHNMASVEEVCDNIALINKAEKILDGSIHEIRNAYKQNIFELECLGSHEQLLKTIPEEFKIVEAKEDKGVNFIKVSLPNENDINNLLSKLLPSFQLKSFREITPSMHDIFIKVVNEH